jgi:hypothetical protein
MTLTEPLEANMETAEKWATRIKAEKAAKTPEQKAADEANFREWLAGLPVLPPLPTKPGEVLVIFIKRKPKGEGSPPPAPDDASG